MACRFLSAPQVFREFFLLGCGFSCFQLINGRVQYLVVEQPQNKFYRGMLPVFAVLRFLSIPLTIVAAIKILFFP